MTIKGSNQILGGALSHSDKADNLNNEVEPI